MIFTMRHRTTLTVLTFGAGLALAWVGAALAAVNYVLKDHN